MKNNNSGFTLLELMIVVAIAGILLMAGIPSFRSMIITNDVTSVTNDLNMSLKMARNAAITSGHNASVCSSKDGKKCSASNNDWDTGWLVWVDLDNDNGLDAGTSELLWVKEIDPKSNLTITASSNFSKQIDFKYNGSLLQETIGDFKVCSGLGSTDGFPQRLIGLTVAGEPQFSKITTTKC